MEAIEIFQEIKIGATVVHVISIILGMGGGLMSDILFSFFSKDKKLNNTELKTLSVLKKVVFFSLILIIISGATVFLSDVEKYTHSSKFLAKISIFIVLLINGYILNKYIWPHLINKGFFTLKKERNIRKLAFVCGAVSVISWLSVCTLGVLDALSLSYKLIISIYLIIVIIGIIFSLLIEKRELN